MTAIERWDRAYEEMENKSAKVAAQYKGIKYLYIENPLAKYLFTAYRVNKAGERFGRPEYFNTYDEMMEWVEDEIFYNQVLDDLDREDAIDALYNVA